MWRYSESKIDYVVRDDRGGALYRSTDGQVYQTINEPGENANPGEPIVVWRSGKRFYLEIAKNGKALPVEILSKREVGKLR